MMKTSKNGHETHHGFVRQALWAEDRERVIAAGRRWVVTLFLAAGFAMLWVLPTLAQDGSKVAFTRHNLTASGPGPIRVEGESRVCIFCHTPHRANPVAPLWNRMDPGVHYQTYESSTLEAAVGQPTGSSRLCLSCHDGTIALTQTYNPRNAPRGTVFLSPRDSGYLGTDLSDDHPISFIYDSALAVRKGQMRDPNTLPPELPLDHEQRLQCTTCHDPHDNQFGHFLRMQNDASTLCRQCHEMTDWPISVHATSNASLLGAGFERWSKLGAHTVAEAACEACHRPHTAGGRQRLMRLEAEEDNCFTCHDGSVADEDLRAEFLKPSTHPVMRFTGVHDPKEDPSQMREHVECSDCHNPHQIVSSGIARAPFIKPTMQGAAGVSASGITVSPARYEYEVCYKCHGRRNIVRSPLVSRVDPSKDLSDVFSLTSFSYHPVEGQGKNINVPSLLEPYKPTSIIYCTDCHGSDDQSGTTALSGPHGSIYRPLLVREYSTRDLTVESSQAYALCYGCHNRASILNNESFSEHRKHIVDERTPCSVCHDAHGARRNENLINFDRNVVQSSRSNGQGPTFQKLGPLRGSCTLNCHGEDHQNLRYPEGDGD